MPIHCNCSLQPVVACRKQRLQPNDYSLPVCHFSMSEYASMVYPCRHRVICLQQHQLPPANAVNTSVTGARGVKGSTCIISPRPHPLAIFNVSSCSLNVPEYEILAILGEGEQRGRILSKLYVHVLFCDCANYKCAKLHVSVGKL